jgi:hypothetical protein
MVDLDIVKDELGINGVFAEGGWACKLGTYRRLMLTDGSIYDAEVRLYFTGFGYAL